MPQDSLLYAVGRLRMLRRNLLGDAQLLRLISAQDTQEAERVLLEVGYITAEQPDVEKASVLRAQRAAQMVRKLSPAPQVTDAFLQRHDALNLKVLLKARVLGEQAEGLSHAGTLPPETLRHAVEERSYKRLPPALRQAMEQLEKRLATRQDPMEIDVLLDKGLYQLMAEGIAGSKEPTVRKWMAMKADYANLRAYLRLKGMDVSLSLQEVLLPGGQIPLKAFQDADAQWEKLLRLYGQRYGKGLAAEAAAALGDRERMQALEKRMEQQLNGLFAPQRMQPDSLDVLIDYLQSVEQESAAVRLIMAGKRNRLTPEQIEERLR